MYELTESRFLEYIQEDTIALLKHEGEERVLTIETDPNSNIIELWEKLSRTGIKRISEKYTWSAAAKSYMKVFKEVLKNYKGPGKINIPEYFIKRDKRSEKQLLIQLKKLYS